MTTIIAVGDPHFKHNNKAETDIMHQEVLKKINNIKPDAVVILGDVFDSHCNVHIQSIKRGTDFIVDISNLCPTYILVGNHDMNDNKQFFPSNHSLYAYKEYSNVEVINKTKIIMINDIMTVMVPYVPPGRFLEALDYVEDWKEAKIIFAHQEFNGGLVTPYRISTTGDHWPKEFPQIISGHLHKRHKLRDNIYYPGSPQQVKINDDEDRSIAKIKIDENNNLNITKIPIKSLIKRLVTLKISELKNFQPEEGIKLKIKLVGTQEEHKELVTKSNKISKLKNMGIDIRTDIKIPKNNIIKHEDKTYKEIVYEEIGNNEDLKKLYEDITKEL